MEKIYNELDEVKIEMEKLRGECLTKADLSESLRKAHVEQLAIIQQSKLEMESLAQELKAKSVEICQIRQIYKELQSSLNKKDFFLQEISFTNVNLRAEYGEKILQLEGKNRVMSLSLEEASTRIQDLENKTCASSEEITYLKKLLAVDPEKVEVNNHVSKCMEDRDDCILKMEEEMRIVHDKLRWKEEQFSLLEEAHMKLQSQFQENKGEWQEEKSLLLDKITSLQANLDGHVNNLKSLESQLRMANEALAQEESKEKVLEGQLSECRSQFEDVLRECHVAKLEIVQTEEKNMELNQQLQLKDTELHKVHGVLKQRCNEITVLMKKVESSESLNLKDNPLEVEIKKHKLMLKESNEHRCTLEQQLLEEHMKNENTQNALEMVNFELANRTSEVEQSRLLLQKLKSEVQSLRSHLEEIQEAHNQEKASLLSTVNEKGVEIAKLREHVSNLESTLLEKSQNSNMICQEKDMLDGALKAKILEIEDKNQIIAKLEKEVSHLRQEGEFQGRSLIQSNQRVLQLEHSLQAHESEIRELKCQLEKDRSCFQDRLEEHESCKQALLEDLMKASYDKECLIAQLEGIYRRVEVFCQEDVELLDLLGKILHLSEGDSEPRRNLSSSSDGNDQAWPHSGKSIQVICAGRTPLTELNCIERV